MYLLIIRVGALDLWGKGKRPSAGGGHIMTYAVEERDEGVAKAVF